jgi:hypothetical protein
MNIEDKKKLSGYLDSRLDVLDEIKQGLRDRKISQYNDPLKKLKNGLRDFGDDLSEDGNV